MVCNGLDRIADEDAKAKEDLHFLRVKKRKSFFA